MTCTQWASGWLAFQRRVANAYPSLDLNFESLVTRRQKSHFPPTVLESLPPRLRLAPLLRLLLPLLRMTSKLLCIILIFFFYVGLQTRDIRDVVLNEYPIFYLLAIFLFLSFYNCFPDAALTSTNLDRWLSGLCLSS